jgi:serine/threonine protein kinase
MSTDNQANELPKTGRDLQDPGQLAWLSKQGNSLPETPSYATTPTDPAAPWVAGSEDYSFLTAPQSPTEIGRLGGYRILGVLGVGGMGIVFRAEEQQPRRLVAVKVMKPALAVDPTVRRRFLKEGQLAASVDHPGVVPIYRVDEAQGVPFLVMPMLKGRSLERLLQERQRLSAKETMRIGREIAETLSAAHAAGLIHRDVKPSNIWLREGQSSEDLGVDAATWPVMLLDFGVARAVTNQGESVTQKGETVGTPEYMAPEQLGDENLDGRADLFSLGCVMYRMLVGSNPFGGRNIMAVLCNIALEQPQTPHQIDAAIPPELSDLVMRLMSKKPEDRPATATAVAAELRHMEQASVPPVKPTPKPRRRWWLPVMLMSLLAVGVASAIWALMSPSESASPSAPLGPVEPKPFRVTALRVTHRSGQEESVLGEKSFGARVNDKFTIQVELSEPAYVYVLAFIPNGSEHCLTELEGVVASEKRQKLDLFVNKDRPLIVDDSGLWTFAVVASRKPLPPHAEWVKQRGQLKWLKVNTLQDVVWTGTEGSVRPLTNANDPRKPDVPAVLSDLLKGLETAPSIETVRLMAFTVTPK